MIGQRKFKEVIGALFEYQHYKALFNMWRLYPDFLEGLRRYVGGGGNYPCDLGVRSPEGLLSMRLYSYHDMLTANEVFCRHDYVADHDIRFVVDIGSNIGISALYFLSRNKESRCLLYEPDPKNIARLKHNLSGFENRYTLFEAAVSNRSGQIPFGVEPTGRYGGIGVQTGQTITVDCVDINSVLRNALQHFPRVDILKLDIEGAEISTVEAIDSSLSKSVRRIYVEAKPKGALIGDLFRNRQYGSVRRLIRRDA